MYGLGRTYACVLVPENDSFGANHEGAADESPRKAARRAGASGRTRSMQLLLLNVDDRRGENYMVAVAGNQTRGLA
ncbi:hypothetical protein MRX96_027889 [Rhipicephalus microplus]